MIIVIISEVTIILQRERRIFLLASHCLNIHVMSMSDFLTEKGKSSAPPAGTRTRNYTFL